MPIPDKIALLAKLAAASPGLWANIRAKKKRGETTAKPGDKDYPDSKNWRKVTSISEKKANSAQLGGVKNSPDSLKTSSIRELVGGLLNNKNENSSLDSKWGLMGGALVTAPATLANMAYNKMVMPSMFGPRDPEGYKKLRAVAKADGVYTRSVLDPIREMRELTRETTNPISKWSLNRKRRAMHKMPGGYDLIHKEIITNPKYRSPAIFAHELGHHRGGRALGLTGLAGKNLMGLGAAGALWSGDENTSKNFALGGTAAAAPMMASELDASWRGMRAMRQAGLKGGWRAFGGVPTYAAIATAPMLAHYGKKYFGGFNPTPSPDVASLLQKSSACWKGYERVPANDPDSRINKALRKWKCGSDMAEIQEQLSRMLIARGYYGKIV